MPYLVIQSWLLLQAHLSLLRRLKVEQWRLRALVARETQQVIQS